MLRAIGLRDEADPGEADVWLWPCNLPAWQAWCDVQTQWRVGMGGATGLDYAAVLALLRTVHRLHGDELRECFACVRAAELAVLELWADDQRRH